jgi:lipoprotein signal peptidase
MRTKKVQKSRQTFRSVSNSVGNVVDICADGHVSDMREPSVISSVYSVGNAVGIRADGHVADMRDPSV